MISCIYKSRKSTNQLMISLVQRLNSIHKVFIFWFEFEDSTQITMMNLIREKNTPAYCDKKKKTLLSSPIHFTVLWCWCHDTCKCRQQTTTRYDRKNQLFVTLSNIKKKQRQKMVQFVTSLQYKLFLWRPLWKLKKVKLKNENTL